jgi:hypothetical protein
LAVTLIALPTAWSAVSSTEAGAVECAPIVGGSPALAEVDAAERLRFLRTSLDDAARRSRRWRTGWAIGYASLTAGQLAISPAFDADTRRDYYVGAFGSAVGLTVALVAPPKVIHDQRWLERRISSARAGTDTCALLAEAERLLLRDAAFERFGQSWVIHAGNFAFNLGLGLILALWFHHFRAAAINTVVGATIGEIQINTQPTPLGPLLERYREARLGSATPSRMSWSIAPLAVERGFGASLALLM